MRRLRTRKRFRDILSSPIVVVLLVIVTVFLLRAAWHSFTEYRNAFRARAAAEARADALAAHNARLSDTAAHLGSAREAEGEIREKLHMARPGEEVIVVTNDGTSAAPDAPTAERLSWWTQFMNWIAR